MEHSTRSSTMDCCLGVMNALREYHERNSRIYNTSVHTFEDLLAQPNFYRVEGSQERKGGGAESIIQCAQKEMHHVCSATITRYLPSFSHTPRTFGREYRKRSVPTGPTGHSRGSVSGPGIAGELLCAAFGTIRGVSREQFRKSFVL